MPAVPTTCGIDVLDGVASLVDKSLLRQEDGPDGEPRYRMLETVREFALERLADERRGGRCPTIGYSIGCSTGIDPALAVAGASCCRVARDPNGRGWFGDWERELPQRAGRVGLGGGRDDVERLLRLAVDLAVLVVAPAHRRGPGVAGARLSPPTGCPRARAPWTHGAGRPRQRRRGFPGRPTWCASARRCARSPATRKGWATPITCSAWPPTAKAIMSRPSGSMCGAGSAAVGRQHRNGPAGPTRIRPHCPRRGDPAAAAAALEEALTLQETVDMALPARWPATAALPPLTTSATCRRRWRATARACRYWEGIGDLGGVAICLEGIAWTVCILGDARRAALLLGAAQKRQRGGRIPDAGASPGPFGGVVAGVHRPRLGRLHRGWLAGRALSLDAAVAEAYRADPRERGAAARPEARCQHRRRRRLDSRELDVLACWSRGGRTGRSGRRSSSAPAPCKPTSPTSSPSSASMPGQKQRLSPCAGA